jgi:lipopolysaccharide transport system ATP-binding protein
MSSENAISVQHISKSYQLYETPADRLKQFVVPKFQRFFGGAQKRYFDDFWALNDVSLDIKKGETVGILGRNGSGKSTLLQIISGTLFPTLGNVQTNGRIAALLELGSGFNPEFTGRENVFVNGAILGLSRKEIESKFQSIVDFADIGTHIDHPVKTYSSGMIMRLAFAVQAQVSPAILIVDEALAVGDAKFQAKCFARLKELKDQGTSILLVTHSTEQVVTHCSRAILMDGGRLLENGDPRFVANRYLDLLFGRERHEEASNIPAETEPSQEGPNTLPILLSRSEDRFFSRPLYNTHEYRWGDGKAQILDFYVEADREQYPAVIRSGDIVTLSLSVRISTTIGVPIVGCTVKTKEGVTVYGANSETLGVSSLADAEANSRTILVRMAFKCSLAPGDYFVSVGVASRQGEEVIPHDRRYDSIHINVAPHGGFFGIADLGLTMKLEGIK